MSEEIEEKEVCEPTIYDKFRESFAESIKKKDKKALLEIRAKTLFYYFSTWTWAPFIVTSLISLMFLFIAYDTFNKDFLDALFLFCLAITFFALFNGGILLNHYNFKKIADQEIDKIINLK